MSFSAGGANVGGVQQTEAGTTSLSVTSTTLSVAGGETQLKYYAVPTGHKWVVKSLVITSPGFTGTRSFTAAGFRIGGTDTIAVVSGSSGDISLNLPSPITLTAGQEVFFQAITSAWTSGQLTLKFLYNDVTV